MICKRERQRRQREREREREREVRAERNTEWLSNGESQTHEWHNILNTEKNGKQSVTGQRKKSPEWTQNWNPQLTGWCYTDEPMKQAWAITTSQWNKHENKWWVWHFYLLRLKVNTEAMWNGRRELQIVEHITDITLYHACSGGFDSGV